MTVFIDNADDAILKIHNQEIAELQERITELKETLSLIHKTTVRNGTPEERLVIIRGLAQLELATP